MKKNLTSRERVKKAIRFEEPDRIPIDIGGNYCTGICVDAYVELVKYLGYDLDRPKVYEPFLMLTRLDEKVRQRLHSDVMELENPSPRWNIENKDWKVWKNQKGNELLMPGGFNAIEENEYLWIKDKNGKALARMPKGGLYFDYVDDMNLTADFVPMNPKVWKKSIPLYSEEHLRWLEKDARRLYEETEYSICGGFYKGGMTMVPSIAGHSFCDWLCILMTERDYAYSIIQATAERAIENLELYLQAVGKYIDTIVVSATDYGSQKNELFPPDVWRDIYLPNYKKINDYAHKHTDAKTFFHSCGSVAGLLPYFIEAGVDIVNPIQTTAENMDPVKLKEQFGGKIVFWGGGVDTQTVLPFGSPDEVREQVKQRLKLFAPGGGFVFTQIHDIQHGVPPENILAMADTVYEQGKYSVN
jgi:uroporphyrinogen decarboxylase